MNTSRWIAHIDALRCDDALLARGAWHGYTESAEYSGVAPMLGRYYLVRWAQPTVAVSHDDTEETVRLAHSIEKAVGAP